MNVCRENRRLALAGIERRFGGYGWVGTRDFGNDGDGEVAAFA